MSKHGRYAATTSILCTLLIGCSTFGDPGPEQANWTEFEVVPADETSQIEEIATNTILLQRRRAAHRAEQAGAIRRGVHPKSHGCVTGEFAVLEDLPTELQVGLFAKPRGSFDVLIRYSNAAVTLTSDQDGGNGSRGMAIKIFDVPGEMIIKDNGRANQDFLMINTPMFAFPNVRSYQRLTDALLASPDGTRADAMFDPTGLAVPDLLDLRKTAAVIGLIRETPVHNPLEVAYFAAAPSGFANGRAMKYSVMPCEGPKPQQSLESMDPNQLHQALRKRMGTEEALCLMFSVQPITLEQVLDHRASTSGTDLIEDATNVWDEDAFPFHDVAKITVPAPQTIDLSNPEQQDCANHAFNPWHTLKAHTPLGGINRLRKPVYANSAGTR